MTSCPCCGFPVDGPPFGSNAFEERRVLLARIMDMESEREEFVVFHRYCALNAALEKAAERTKDETEASTYVGWELWHTELVVE